MITTPLRAAPRPYEEVIIASTLESASSQDALMATIHRLSQERSQVQARLNRSLWRDCSAAARIHAITVELESCWAEVRRQRAARRVHLEEALGVDPAAFEQVEQQQSPALSAPPTRTLAKRRRHVPLPYAS